MWPLCCLQEPGLERAGCFRLGTTHPRIFWTSPAPVSLSKALNHKFFSIVLSPFGPGRISDSAFCICWLSAPSFFCSLFFGRPAIWFDPSGPFASQRRLFLGPSLLSFCELPASASVLVFLLIFLDKPFGPSPVSLPLLTTRFYSSLVFSPLPLLSSLVYKAYNCPSIPRSLPFSPHLLSPLTLLLKPL